MVRLFTGFELPGDLRRLLASLGGGVPGARWVPEDALHVTLRFIGEIDEAGARAIDGALSSLDAPPFTLSLAGSGTFARGRHVHSLWIGVEATAPLLLLREKVDSILVRNGLAPEERKYRPHLTLARLSGKGDPSRLARFVAGHALFRAAFAVDHLTLFSSLGGAGRPVYRAEAGYPLTDRGKPVL